MWSAAPSQLLNRAALLLAAVFCVALLAADVRLGEPEDLWWWLLALIVLAWQSGPVLLAAILVRASRSRAGQFLFLSLAVAFCAVTADVVVAVLRSTRSTAAVALVFAPLYLYLALLLVVIVAGLLGWRARDSWLRD